MCLRRIGKNIVAELDDADAGASGYTTIAGAPPRALGLIRRAGSCTDPGLALDLMEELRPVFTDRLARWLINRRQLQSGNFETRRRSPSC